MAPENPRPNPSRNAEPEQHDPRSRFGLYRLCHCPTCDGKGQVPRKLSPYAEFGAGFPIDTKERCPDCRGEGRIRQEVASAESPEAIGVALVTLSREGEWEGCQFGLLDREGETGKRWLVLPYPETARTVTAAARLLAKSRKR